MKKLILLVIALSLSACASSQLDAGANKVKTMKGDPSTKCDEIGIVNSIGGGFGWQREDVKRARLKNRAAEMGGNYIRLDIQDSNGNYTATVYSCPDQA